MGGTSNYVMQPSTHLTVACKGCRQQALTRVARPGMMCCKILEILNLGMLDSQWINLLYPGTCPQSLR